MIATILHDTQPIIYKIILHIVFVNTYLYLVLKFGFIRNKFVSYLA